MQSCLIPQKTMQRRLCICFLYSSSCCRENRVSATGSGCCVRVGAPAQAPTSWLSSSGTDLKGQPRRVSRDCVMDSKRCPHTRMYPWQVLNVTPCYNSVADSHWFHWFQCGSGSSLLGSRSGSRSRGLMVK
jgi:hypothetical protein